MFNSRKINNDPLPYQEIRNGMRMSPDYAAEFGHEFVYDPRPEYDNDPNPILVQFRKDRDFTRLEILDERFPHENHAKRVLEKLVNVYG